MRQHEAAGWACRTPRRIVLPDDPAVEAAHRLRGRGGRVIDLTHAFCGRRRCFPVIGGALVHKDVDHLSQPFARTLGPHLLRAIERLPYLRAAGRY